MSRFILLNDVDKNQFGEINPKAEHDELMFPPVAMTAFDSFHKNEGDFMSLSKIIDAICKIESITIVVVFDTKKNICFIYKYPETMDHIKKEFLPYYEKPYQYITHQEMVIEKFENLRELTKLGLINTNLN